MSLIVYDFKQAYWTMEKACQNPSINPAPVTKPCIYIIHNANTNETYVGYAKNANDRWKTRTEVFHCFGIEKSYAKKILCACCVPYYYDEKTKVKTDLKHNELEGKNKAEHLLIRAVVRGVVGTTTSTNTSMGKVQFNLTSSATIVIFFPKLGWIKLRDWEITYKNFV